MAAFDANFIDRTRIDVNAIIDHRGIAVVDDLRHKACLRWLSGQGYQVATIDFGQPFTDILTQIGQLFNWECEFGYRFEDGTGSLDALADGFEFPSREGVCQVLEILEPEKLAAADRRWFNAFLEIASDHSAFRLACGSRFFTLLVATRESWLPGSQFASTNIPSPFWNPNARKHGFLE